MSHIHATLFITFFLAFSVIVNYVFHKLLTLSHRNFNVADLFTGYLIVL